MRKLPISRVRPRASSSQQGRRSVRVLTMIAAATASVAAGGVIQGGALSAAPALAATPDVSAVSAASLGSRAFSDEEMTSTSDYWTVDRLQRAIPDDGSASVVGASDAGSGVVHSVSGSITATAWVGKIAFRRGGLDRLCSASAVHSDSGYLVATAGHCLLNDDQTATGVTFVPGWDGKNMPYGTWIAKFYSVTPEWRVRADDSHDVGFIKVQPIGSKSLADTVSALRVNFSLAKPQLHYFSLAYGNIGGGFQAKPLSTCVGPAYRLHDEQSLAMIGCKAVGGMSGGPVYHASTEEPRGTQVGVIGRNVETAYGDAIAFTPFGKAELSTYKTVDSFTK
ncbi:conserved hypothetical protein, putative extracellular serine protease [Clavibacter michiganensis subsp. michiganensis NCPPB 382]|uniref:Serine protease n=2 Tax=Clavibacter michiganensis TaxID=28447 RepID=A5CLX8_CLAM3|nr:conserved hypothetical protein, putative extracellular serine protease [Clavibacter michiganensis subsp. michiganensis NCPPB 382]